MNLLLYPVFLPATLKIKLNCVFVDIKGKDLLKEEAGEFKDSLEKDVDAVVEENNL